MQVSQKERERKKKDLCIKIKISRVNVMRFVVSQNKCFNWTYSETKKKNSLKILYRFELLL